MTQISDGQAPWLRGMVRFKNRYLLVQVEPCDGGALPSGSFAPSAIANLIRTNLELNFGCVAAARAHQSFSVKYANGNTRMVIVRTAREMLEPVWASLSLLSTVLEGGEQRWRWRVVHVAGTIRSCHQAAIKYARKQLGVLNQTLLSQIKSIEA